ncbi:DUF418 domain-containing protein [Microlunatus speluncae]|uniref:DUF418 domain-containing protein n=1 Tax=Microlunatus speluncae TaxID=2594267 RepID=UPI0012661BF3|nr:DUF418 domain-containing protein [Microlunatus speluncae]
MDHAGSLQSSTSSRRFVSLDVLRGVAIAGIFPLNSVAIWITAGAIPVEVFQTAGWTGLRLFFQGHFLPLFSLLFGLSFGMVWRAGRDTRVRPRAALARRAGFLVILGLPHQLFAPGEALLIYGLSGLIFLLPSTLLPRRRAAPVLGLVGLIGIVAGLAIEAQLFTLIGLQLAGFALGILGAAGRWESPSAGRAIMITGVSTGALALAGATLLVLRPELQASYVLLTLVQLVMAAGYVALVLGLMRTRLAPALVAAFEPLGRTALTCYLSATVLITFGAAAVRALAPDPQGLGTWLGLTAWVIGVLAIQNLGMRLWLRRFRRGPLEELWRRFTWWTRDGRPTPRPVPASVS